MRIVITGALGHIGSRLLRVLPERFPGAEILLLDNLLTQRYCSLFDLPGDGRYRFVEADILTAELDSMLAGANAVVHLAAITDAPNSFAIREQVERVNFEGTERVARACLRTDASLIFLSTTSVYGPQGDTVDEDCPSTDLRPQSPYAESKLRSERLLTQLGEREGLRFITCRFGTIFGVSPGMRFHTAINKFCWQAAVGMPITVWRTALDQRRPYLDLEDAMGALALILEKGLCDRRVYNIVTANATVKNIVDAIVGFVPDLSIELVDSPIMNQLSYTVSDHRFRERGFVPRGSLQEGIGRTISLLKGVRQR
jgi:nucleoside-diphosphate-sugar epimerase